MGRARREPAFEEGPAPDRAADEPAFTVDVEGFEGPLDLLLELARRQKVDLSRISILELADQYLAFVEAARKRRLELAADYLVMAAWLAYLKSRLLLPSPPKEETEDAADLAEKLAQRLRRLEIIRRAADLLMKRPQLGRDVFARGRPESIDLPSGAAYSASLYDLISAYARQSQKRARTFVRMKPREVWSLAQARDALGRLIGQAQDWVSLDRWLIEYCVEPKLRRSARASSFSASLEMVREGVLELRQDAHFAPLFLRRVEKDAGGRPLALVES
ncbi:MAG TPA: ScpA family protein [Roseiarcus sp.]|nr:ScpA family protein [Roseiarcus sp.]